MQQLQLEPAPDWVAGIAGGGLIPCTTRPASAAACQFVSKSVNIQLGFVYLSTLITFLFGFVNNF